MPLHTIGAAKPIESDKFVDSTAVEATRTCTGVCNFSVILFRINFHARPKTWGCHSSLSVICPLEEQNIFYQFISTNTMVTTGALLEHICRHVCFATDDTGTAPNMGMDRAGVQLYFDVA